MSEDNKTKTPRYDIEYLKQIPITTILYDYQIDVRHEKFKIRDEKTPSCKVFSRTNTWYDFGSNEGGSAIDLICQIEKVDFKDACQIMGARYDAPVINNSKPDATLKALSESQYNLIGLHGSPVYLNILLPKYADSFTGEMVESMKNKYSMSMNQLFKSDINTYSAIITSESIPFMKSCYNNYLNSLRVMASDAQKFGVTSLEYKLSKDTANGNTQEYNNAYNALVRAVKGTDIDIKQLKPNYEKDLARINKISIEIGDFSYTELKQLPGEMRHIDVGVEAYNTFHHAVTYEELHIDANYSAHVKGDTVTISCKAQDENTIKGIFQSIEVQQQYQQQQKAPVVSSGLDL